MIFRSIPSQIILSFCDCRELFELAVLGLLLGTEAGACSAFLERKVLWLVAHGRVKKAFAIISFTLDQWRTGFNVDVTELTHLCKLPQLP